MAIEKVALVGANGNLGSKILEALRAESSFVVSVVRRASSRSVSSLGRDINGRDISVLTVGDDLQTPDLIKALQGQDAVIASFPLSDVEEHLRLAEASALAGVKRFIPADFGSCDAATERAQELLALYRKKIQVRQRAEKLVTAHESFSWTALTCGHFFDWGLKEKFLHFDIPARKAELLDGGDHRASYSTLSRVADAVVRVLLREDQTRNQALYIQSFCVTEKEVLESLQRVTGEQWKTENLDYETFMEEQKALVAKGDKAAIEELVWALGTVDADWRARDGFAMEILGLEDEDLDEVVTRVVAES